MKGRKKKKKQGMRLRCPKNVHSGTRKDPARAGLRLRSNENRNGKDRPKPSPNEGGETQLKAPVKKIQEGVGPAEHWGKQETFQKKSGYNRPEKGGKRRGNGPVSKKKTGMAKGNVDRHNIKGVPLRHRSPRRKAAAKEISPAHIEKRKVKKSGRGVLTSNHAGKQIYQKHGKATR